MNNIKMSSAGGKWLLAMLVYFTFFIALNGTVNLVGEDSVSNYATGVSSLTFSNYTGLCLDQDRLFIDNTAALGNRSTLTLGNLSNSQRTYLNFFYGSAYSNLDCEYNYGNIGEAYCTFEGCTWNSTTDTCEGEMDSDYYGINSTSTIIPIKSAVARHENTPWYYFSNIGLACNHPLVERNETLCRQFTCTWLSSGTIEYNDVTEEDKNIKEIYNKIKTIFSFSKTFNTDSATLNFVLGVIFVLLPLLILALSLWFVFNPVK